MCGPSKISNTVIIISTAVSNYKFKKRKRGEKKRKDK